MKMNFIVIIATMAAFWHRTVSTESERKGKFLGLSSEDMLSDILDEIYDPLPLPSNTISVRDHVLQKIKNKKEKAKEKLPPIRLPPLLLQKITTTTPSPASIQSNVEAPSNFLQIKRNSSQQQPLLLYDSSTDKFEITPPGFASHVQPITEGMFLVGGQFGQQGKPQQNLSTRKGRFLWGFVGDFIESIPFLPIQVNVPDLLAAMAEFISQRVPFFNRFDSPEKPRPNTKLPTIASAEPILPTPVSIHPEAIPLLPSVFNNLPIETNILEYRQMVPKSQPKKKKRKKNKKNKRTTTVSYYNTPRTGFQYETTEASKIKSQLNSQKKGTPSYKGYTPRAVDANPPLSKWFQKTTEAIPTKTTQTTADLKLFHHNNNPGSEQIRYNGFTATKKINRFAEREVFNFKHSDISNSPIMILNIPSRPIYYYKLNQEKEQLSSQSSKQKNH